MRPLPAILRLYGVASALFLAASPGLTWADAPAPTVVTSYDVQWRVVSAPSAWVAGAPQAIRLEVRNGGNGRWASAAETDAGRAVRLSYCWTREGASPWECFTRRIELPLSVDTGGRAVLPFSLTAPPDAGSYSLEFDLVHENVTWFRDAGAQTLVIPAAVLPPPGQPSKGGALLRVALCGIAGLTLLVHCGWGVTAFLWPGARKGALPFVPAVGLSVLAAVGHALARIGQGTDTTFAAILAAFGLVNVVAWLRGRRLPLAKGDGPALAITVAALAVALVPLVLTGQPVTVAGEIDAVLYVARAEWMQGHSMLAFAERPWDGPIAVMVASAVKAAMRQGDQYFLAMFASVTGLRPHRVFSVANAILLAVLPLGAYALAKGLRLPLRAALLCASLVAASPLLSYVALNGFLSQVAGLALFPFAFLACLAAVRRGVRRAPLAGLLVAGVAMVYPAYLAFLLPAAAGTTLARVALRSWARLRRGRAPASVLTPWGTFAWRWAAVAACAYMASPLGWALAHQQMVGIAGLAGGGSLGAQAGGDAMPNPGAAFGLVSHAHDKLLLPQPWMPARAATPLAVLAFGSSLASLALVRGRARLALGFLLLVLGLGVVQQRFLLDGGRGFAYGTFKVMSLLAPVALLGLAVAFARSLASAAGIARVASVVTWVVTAVVVAASLANLASSARAMTTYRQAVDASAEELESIRTLVPPDETILLSDRTWPGRAWTMYLLHHEHLVSRDSYPSYDPGPEARAPRLVRYALLEQSSPLVPGVAEPWADHERSAVLWQNARFRLVERHEAVLAEIRLERDDFALRLDQGVVVLADPKGLSIEAPGLLMGRLTQSLSWCPDAIEAWVHAPAGARLTESVVGSVPRVHVLSAGAQRLTFPAGPPRRLQAAGARLLVVRALGGLATD